MTSRPFRESKLYRGDVYEALYLLSGDVASLNMSVVVQNSTGWFLDTCSLIDEGYSRCIRHSKGGKQSRLKCRFKGQCFRINKSYSSANASAATDGGNVDKQNTDKPTKVKRPGVHCVVFKSSSHHYQQGSACQAFLQIVFVSFL